MFRKDLRLGIYRVLRRNLWRNPFRDQLSVLKDIADVDVIFDVGANVGEITQKYLSLFSEATIHAFEPFPDSFAFLKQRFVDSRNVVLNQCAVSDNDGDVILYLGKSNFTHSLLRMADKSKADKVSITVNGAKLDSYCSNHGIKRINILKLDIQGGEYAALIGATELLASCAIDLIYMEVMVSSDYEDYPNWHEVGSFLGEYSYMFFNFYNFSESNIGQIRQFDAIYLSPNVRQKIFSKYGTYDSGYYNYF